MIEELSLTDNLKDNKPVSLAGILLHENVTHVQALIQSSPTGILLTGSDHFTRRSIVQAAAPETTFLSASHYVLQDAPPEELPAKGVVCIEDADTEGGLFEGAIKGLFLAASEGRVIIGLAASDTRVPSSLLRASRFERVHRVKGPTTNVREEAWKYILHTILTLDHQFTFPPDAATRLATISPGYGLPDFMSILYMYLSCKVPAMSSSRLFQESPFLFDSIEEMIGSHEPMRGSIDLDFVTSNAHAPGGAFPHLSLNWSGHAGYDDLKQSLIHLCEWPVSHYATFLRLGVTPPRGVLLHGPHGCGKTMVAMAFLRRLRHANWLHVHAPDLFSKYLGESEAHVRSLFGRARQLAPCVVFIDELDAIGASRDGQDDGGSGVERRVLGSLLTELDGVTGGQLFVLACAADIKKLDVALVRPGRLDHVLEIGLPDADDRHAILKELLKEVPISDAEGAVIDSLVVETKGMSGADLSGLCREAAMIAVEEEDDAEYATYRHFKEALQTFKGSGRRKQVMQ